jgi:hypothetical protein
LALPTPKEPWWTQGWLPSEGWAHLSSGQPCDNFSTMPWLKCKITGSKGKPI